MPKKSAQTIPYNELAVRKVATTKHAKQADYTIATVPGLVLTVFPSGSASFAVRFTVDGKRRRESIGPWGVIELADARKKALSVAAGAADDVDVLAKEAKDAALLTLRQMFEARMAKDDTKAASTLKSYKGLLERDIFPALGAMPADKITADEFAEHLQVIEDASKHTAHRIRSALGSTYRWAQRRRLVKVNPIAGLAFTHQSKPRKRILSDAEMAKLWTAIGQCEADGTIIAASANIIRLAILTGQRNNEVAGMEVAELKGLDTATPRWDIPGRRMKRKEHDQFVPLSRQAVEIINRALADTSNGVHVFQSGAHGRRKGVWRQTHIGQQGVSRATAKVVKAAGLHDVHLHDMRKCATSWLAEHGHATGEVLDAILHHAKEGVTGTHYNFALYEKQVRTALQVWADHVAGLGTSSKHCEKVVQLAATR